MSEAKHRKHIVFYVNRQRIEISDERAFLTFPEFIRYQKGLTGTKVVCAEGDCGACTILRGNVGLLQNGGTRYKSINSCIVPLYLLDGSHLITVEGIADGETLHPVQESMIQNNGGQCGYCTPGFICAMSGLAEETILSKKEITEKKARNYLTGNLCRCTGYEPILKAATTMDLSHTKSFQERYEDSDRDRELEKISKQSVHLELQDRQIFLPATLNEALELKKKFPGLRMIAGSTDVGVVVNKGRLETPTVMSLIHVRELREFTVKSSVLEIGALVSLSQIEGWFEKNLPEMGDMIHVFASQQIKNQGTLVGNVVNGSPIADTIPFFMAMNAELVVTSHSGRRTVLVKDFYLGYKKLDLKSDEIVTSIRMPLLTSDEVIKLYKVSLRKDLDISAVTLALFLRKKKDVIEESRVVMGGVGPVVMRLPKLEKILNNQKPSQALFEKMALTIGGEITPLSDVRGSHEFRKQVSHNLFLKCAQDLAQEGHL